MTVRKDWKKEYNTAWGLDKQDTQNFIQSMAYERAIDFCGESASTEEIKGFSSGVMALGCCLAEGLKRVSRVEALKEFQTISSLNPEVTFTQDFYSGFIAGFCSFI